MLTDLSSRDDDLSIAHVVIGHEYHFHFITDVRVVVYLVGYVADKFNDLLCVVVTRGGLTSDKGNSRDSLGSFLRRHLFQF